MTGDQIEQIKRLLEPALREATREVLESELRPFVVRIERLELEIAELKQLRGKMFGIWTLLVFIATLIGKALWDFVVTPFLTNHKP